MQNMAFLFTQANKSLQQTIFLLFFNTYEHPQRQDIPK